MHKKEFTKKYPDTDNCFVEGKTNLQDKEGKTASFPPSISDWLSTVGFLLLISVRVPEIHLLSHGVFVIRKIQINKKQIRIERSGATFLSQGKKNNERNKIRILFNDI